jgi:hypothetical protein
MPVPGSEESSNAEIAHFFNRNIWWLRITGLLIIAFPLYIFKSNWKKRTPVMLVLIVYKNGLIFSPIRLHSNTPCCVVMMKE